MCYVLIGISAEQYAYGGIMAFGSRQIIVHLDVHIHLTYILLFGANQALLRLSHSSQSTLYRRLLI